MTTGKNRKKILVVGWMPQAGLDVLKTRDDVDYEILPLKDVVGSYHFQAQGRQRGHPGRHAVQASRARRLAGHGMRGAARRRLRPGRSAGAQQAQDSADDHRHRQLGLGRRARHVHAAGLCAPHQEDGPLRTRGQLDRAAQRPASRPCRQVDPGGRHGPHRLAHGEALRRLRDGHLCARSQHPGGRHREGGRQEGDRSQGDPAQGRLRVDPLPAPGRNAQPHRCPRALLDETRCLPDQHGPRRNRR